MQYFIEGRYNRLYDILYSVGSDFWGALCGEGFDGAVGES